MARDDVRRDLKELQEQVRALQTALDRALTPYADLARYVEQLQDLSKRYFRFLDLYARHGSVSPEIVVPGLKDDIARHIVAVLVEKEDRNISQIADAVKARRGTASRRIIRDRLHDLEARGTVVASAGPRGRTFRVTEEVLRKWSQVLGVPKYEGQPVPLQQDGAENHE